MREPWGMVHVAIRATSSMLSTATTETELGTISPCRLKFATYANQPSAETWSEAGKYPSSTRDSGRPLAASNFQRYPKGWPWPVVTNTLRPSGDTATPCGPSGSVGMRPTGNSRSTLAPLAPNRTRAMRSTASAATKTR
jgi:hypothetical protein